MLLYFVFCSILEGETDVGFVVNRDAVNQGVPQDLIELCNNAFLLFEFTHKVVGL